MTKEIPLTKGKVTLVDDDWFIYLSQWKWHINGTNYAVRTIHKPVKKDIYMHKVIKPSPSGMITDHINRNRLDNREENLRVCTPTENARNRSMPKHNKSGFMGVYWHKVCQKWAAQAGDKKKGNFHIGVFNTVEQAARAYDKRAKELFGEFARLNFPEENQSGT